MNSSERGLERSWWLGCAIIFCISGLAYLALSLVLQPCLEQVRENIPDDWVWVPGTSVWCQPALVVTSNTWFGFVGFVGCLAASSLCLGARPGRRKGGPDRMDEVQTAPSEIPRAKSRRSVAALSVVAASLVVAALWTRAYRGPVGAKDAWLALASLSLQFLVAGGAAAICAGVLAGLFGRRDSRTVPGGLLAAVSSLGVSLVILGVFLYPD